MTPDFMDPKHLFRMLFGGGRFGDIFGDVSLASIMTMDMNNPLARGILEREQWEKREHLTIKLVAKLQPFVAGKVSEFKDAANKEAVELAESPGGGELLELVAYVYESEGKQHSSNVFGKIFSEVKEKGHFIRSTVDLVSQAVKAQEMQMRLQQSGGTNRALENAMMAEGLKTIWKMGKLDIETTLRKVCEMVLGDLLLAKDIKKKRAQGVLILAEIYHRHAKNASKLDTNMFSPTASYSQPKPKTTESSAPDPQ
eukprot:TRINITY_DN3454_c0_g1_i1.p1 TRINITY_DN3454_c0_g1~~TRINITY_DN3454_c0_g1_i1.p1  ORF type:complete len:255 (+),score=52.85 TRINITY_DN3454_c0_g1_i1:629-1393(+)